MKKIILISGVAGSGKDSFYEVANLIQPEKFQRFAFADELKKEIAESLKEKYDIDIFNCTREQKESVRKELIDYGMQKRGETNGRYWVDCLIPYLESCEKVPMITDFRFKNELDFLAEKFQVYSIYVETYCPKTGKVLVPTIEEEIKNDIDLRKVANDRVFWPHSKGNINLLGAYVSDALEKIGKI